MHILIENEVYILGQCTIKWAIEAHKMYKGIVE